MKNNQYRIVKQFSSAINKNTYQPGKNEHLSMIQYQNRITENTTYYTKKKRTKKATEQGI